MVTSRILVPAGDLCQPPLGVVGVLGSAFIAHEAHELPLLALGHASVEGLPARGHHMYGRSRVARLARPLPLTAAHGLPWEVAPCSCTWRRNVIGSAMRLKGSCVPPVPRTMMTP